MRVVARRVGRSSGLAAALLAAILGGAAVAAPTAAGPVVFRVSDPVHANETVLLFGDNIGPGVRAEGRLVHRQAAPSPPADGRWPIAPPPAAAAPLKLTVMQSSAESAKVLFPETADTGDMLVVVLTNARGEHSSPIYVNRAEPWWWIGGEGDAAYAGEPLDVFGKNFGREPQVWLCGGGKAYKLAMQPRLITVASWRGAAPPYGAHCVLPDVEPGSYQLWIHNGAGGGEGFGRPLAVTVKRRPAPPAATFDVRQLGAAGDGQADDTPAFEAALAAAGKAGGGTAFVPRGTYKITGRLVIPPGTTLRGQRRELVWLMVPTQVAELDTVLAGDHDFTVEDLSIVSQTARRLVMAPDHKAMANWPWPHPPPADVQGARVRLRHLRLHHLRYAHRVQGQDPRRLQDVGPTTVALSGPDMEISDCEIVSSGMPFALREAHHDRIVNNRLDTGRNGWYAFWSADESIMEGNTIEGRDLEASYGGVQGTAYRLYFACNVFRNGYGDEREALTFDTPYGCTWMGQATKVDADRFDTAGQEWKPGQLAGQACTVVYGKGLGQHIPIAAASGSTVVLRQPWAVRPDDTSHVVIRANKSDVIITGNQFADASAAVQLYSQSVGFIIDGNQAVRTGGMYGIGWDHMRRDRRAFSTCWFNQFLNNSLWHGFIYQQGAFLHGVLGPCSATGSGTLEPPALTVLGNVVRANYAGDNNTVGALYYGPHPLAPPANVKVPMGRDTIIEGNDIEDAQVGIDVYPHYVDTLIRENTLLNCRLPLRDDGRNTWIAPVERMLYQAWALQALFPAPDPLHADAREPVETIQRQWKERPNDEISAAQTDAWRKQLWAKIGVARPDGAPRDVPAVLAGLHWEIDPNTALVSLLSSGKGGRADVQLRARTEPWSPVILFQAEPVLPKGWTLAQPAAAAELKPAELQTLKFSLMAPDGADAQAVALRLTAALGGKRLMVPDKLDVSRREILAWSTLGPIPDTTAQPSSTAGKLPDPAVHPPAPRHNLRAEYPSPAGPLRWQPVTLPNRWLHLDRIYQAKTPGGATDKAPATAYAVACLWADADLTANLTLTTDGALEAWLNDASLVTLGPAPMGRTLTVRLLKGHNILLCKSSRPASGAWQLTAEYAESAPGATPRLRQVPAPELAAVPGLGPNQPPRKTPPARP